RRPDGRRGHRCRLGGPEVRWPARCQCRDGRERSGAACGLSSSRRRTLPSCRLSRVARWRVYRLASADAGDTMERGKAVSTPGTLYGIGLGPGDPELMTVKAHRLIASARVVAYPAPD